MGRKRLAIAVISTVMMVSLIGCSNPTLNRLFNPNLVASANYPESVAYDDVDGLKAIKDKNPVSAEYLKGLQNFSAQSATKIISSQEKTANTVYSPLSLFMALAITASGAKNQTQDEILSVLNMKELGIGQLETQTGNLFRLLYTDNKVGKLHLANSVWSERSIQLNKSFVDSATKNYYASLFSVDFSKKETGDLISKWISENTNGMLKGSDPPVDQPILSIINTIYFYDEWAESFNKEDSRKDPFYCADGKTVTWDFMNKTFSNHNFVKGEGFLSSSLAFKNHASINFYLPDKGVNVYDLISTPEKVSALLDSNHPTKVKGNGRVLFQVPKYDFGSKFLLNDALKSLGIKSAFTGNADFSGLSNIPAQISRVLQEAHVTIDEKGCKAAAYTRVDMAVGAAPQLQPENYAEMILDRPFLFTITSPEGVVLFMGIVNNPVAK